jgi:crotonobetainyl-CoA:carnitine CoA-transferase CaiB-like acyl-CoA transferase
MTATPSSPTGPLAGVRILDLTSVIMGPYATQILGDLGADVISIESANGDINRLMDLGPHPELSGVALNLLRNKRNVALDIKRPAARDALLRIVRTCDVFVTNLRPGSLARLRLRYEDVQQERPDIVYCQAHGYPSTSEEADRPAYDDVIQAEGGLASVFELATGTPSLAPTILADKVSGLTMTYAICAALYKRAVSGTGDHIEVPMRDAVASFMLVEHGSSAIPIPPLGPAGYSRVLSPNRRPFRTSDGWICILPYSPTEWQTMLREGGRHDLIRSGAVADRRTIMRNTGFLYEALGQLVTVQTTAYWLAFCQTHGVPVASVASLQQLVERLPEAHHPVAGRYRTIPPPVRFGGGGGNASPAPAPLIGQHTIEVLKEVGLSAEEIAVLTGTGNDKVAIAG